MTFQPWILESVSKLRALRMKLQWSHDLSAMDTCVRVPIVDNLLSFNGAMTFQPWIPLPMRDSPVTFHVASMEP